MLLSGELVTEHEFMAFVIPESHGLALGHVGLISTGRSLGGRCLVLLLGGSTWSRYFLTAAVVRTLAAAC